MVKTQEEMVGNLIHQPFEMARICFLVVGLGGVLVCAAHARAYEAMTFSFATFLSGIMTALSPKIDLTRPLSRAPLTRRIRGLHRALARFNAIKPAKINTKNAMPN